MKTRILIIGANGQLGTVLTHTLQKKYGLEYVIASDIVKKKSTKGLFEILDATDFYAVQKVVVEYKITQIYHLAAILSAKGEQHPMRTWEVNMKTWLTVLEVARIHQLEKVFYPSSIAVFGASAGSKNTSNTAFLDPTTVYGISKASGEHWAHYYSTKYGLDIRSIRYPGVISHQSLPGGGTTDYAITIFHKAVLNEVYECFLAKDTTLPMMYIDDAIRATIEIMEAPKKSIRIRTSYNIAGVSFSPSEMYAEIVKLYPQFTMKYRPDFRQKIASKWPQTIDDHLAQNHWGWASKFDLKKITKEMLQQLEKNYRLDNQLAQDYV